MHELLQAGSGAGTAGRGRLGWRLARAAGAVSLVAAICSLAAVTAPAGAGASPAPAAPTAPRAPSAVAADRASLTAGSIYLRTRGLESRADLRPATAAPQTNEDWNAVTPPGSLFVSDFPTDPLACAPGTTFCMAVMASHAVTTVYDQTGSGVAVTTDLTHWSADSLPSQFIEVLGLSCPAVEHCVAVGSGVSDAPVFALTTDGGADWSVTTPASLASTTYSWPRGVSCPTISLCVAVGGGTGPSGPLQAMVAVSTDGGADWTLDGDANLPGGGGYDLDAVSCSSASDCVAAGSSDPGNVTVLSSADGGISWSASPAPLLGSLGEILSLSCPAGSATCYAMGITAPAGQDEVLLSGDLGHSWIVAWADGGGSLWTIDCPAVLTCWVAGGAGTALVGTDDGFSSLSEPFSGAIDQVPEVSCASTLDCLASTAGAMYVTDDGGGLGGGSGPSGGSIAGTVQGTSGTTVSPLPDVCVYAIGVTTGYLGEGTTLSNGDYTVSGLPADSYVVLFDPTCEGTITTSRYPIELYDGTANGTTDLSQAELVNVDGALVGCIDVDLLESSQVTGTITGPGGGAAGVCVEALTIGGAPYGGDLVNSAVTDASGDFALGNLPLGSYQLLVDPTCAGSQQSDDAMVYWSSTVPTGVPDPSTASTVTFSHPGSTVPGVEVTLEPGASISGDVSAAGAAGDGFVCVWAVTSSGGYFVTGSFTANDGSYTIANLPPGDFAIQFDPTCLGFQQSDYAPAWYGGPGAPGVELTAGSSVGGIDGTIGLRSGVPALAITTGSLPGGTEGAPYQAGVEASGGAGIITSGGTPYNWSATGLPQGLSINATTGEISGTPESPGTASVTLTVLDGSTPPQATSTVVALVVAAPASTPAAPPAPAAVTSSTSSTTSTSTTIATPTVAQGLAVGRSPVVRLDAGTASRRGDEVPLRLSCQRATCRGAVELTDRLVRRTRRDGKTVHHTETVVLGRGAFSLDAGATGDVDVHLNSRGRRLLTRADGSALELVAVISDNGRLAHRTVFVS